jgi:hypothetical protein
MTVEVKKAHAKFGASTAKRWLSCPGSIALIEKAPPQEESKYAQEGTDAHACLEFLVKNRAKLKQACAAALRRWNAAMVAHANAAVMEIEKIAAELPGAEIFAETRADLPVSEPGQFGTTDISIVQEFGTLVIVDYKYGAGIPVPCENNEQLIYYALGIAHQYDYNFSRVVLMIIQPRAAIDGKTVRAWETNVATLLEWRDKFEAGIKVAKKKDAALLSGDHCRFCPAAVICPEIGNKKLRAAQFDFNDETGDIVPQATMDRNVTNPEKLARMLKAFDGLELWIESVRNHAFALARKGTKIPGFKLVEKRGQRKWNDFHRVAEKAENAFGDKVFTRELLSPAQMEKLSPAYKAFIDQNSSSVSSGLTLVDDADPRQATRPADLDFPAPELEKGDDMAEKKKTAKKKAVAKKKKSKK